MNFSAASHFVLTRKLQVTYMPLETTEQLQECLEKWQKRLRLKDWEINIDFCDIRQVNGDLAKVDFDEYHQVAEIRILRPGSWRQQWPMV